MWIFLYVLEVCFKPIFKGYFTPQKIINYSTSYNPFHEAQKVVTDGPFRGLGRSDFYPGFQCHMILQKSFKYADLGHFSLLSILKIFLLPNIFGNHNKCFRILLRMECSKVQHVFEIEVL